MTFCIGVTGGIGSGKSSAAKMFADLGAGVIDTDEISRELTGPGGLAMPEIVANFGPVVAGPDGSLDRTAMRQRVFADPSQRKLLESILHPMIRSEARNRVGCSPAPYVLLLVPLLLEAGGYPGLIRRILVVDCDESTQISRAMRRSNLAADEVRAVMAAQLPRQQRLERADDILHNDGDLDGLRGQVLNLHRRYLDLAKISPPPP